MKDKKQRNIIIALIVVTLLIDQITKFIAYKIGSIIVNENSANNNNGYYIIISIIIILMIIRYISNNNSFIKLDTRIILSFGISGAIGNLIDRIWFNKVITFINLGNKLELNIAYIYIIIAWVGMAVILTKNSWRIITDQKNKRNKVKSNNRK